RRSRTPRGGWGGGRSLGGQCSAPCCARSDGGRGVRRPPPEVRDGYLSSTVSMYSFASGWPTSPSTFFRITRGTLACASGMSRTSSRSIASACAYIFARASWLVATFALLIRSKTAGLLYDRYALSLSYLGKKNPSQSSGSPLSPIHPIMKIGNLFVLRSLRYAAQSSVNRWTRMPILPRSLAIAVPISLPAGKYGRLTGMYQKSSENPLGYFASASSCLAFCGLYSYPVTVCARPHIDGGMCCWATSPNPAYRPWTIACRLIAMATACRLRLSLKRSLLI